MFGAQPKLHVVTRYNYADDNLMIYSSPCINAILRNLINKWFDDNGMKGNPDKFQFMVL